MAEHPIIFSAPMVRAILAGRKTQTRRLLRSPQNATVLGYRVSPKSPAWLGLDWSDCIIRSQSTLMMFVCGRGAPYDPHADVAFWHPDDPKDDDRKCRYRVRPIWDVGDQMWVRERCLISRCERTGNQKAAYAQAGEFELPKGSGEWACKVVPSIHMPRWASRITLEVTAVRVERLREISEIDAAAEGLVRLSKDGGQTWKWGVPEADGLPGPGGQEWKDWSVDPRKAYAALWTSLHTKPGDRWEDNPAVAVIEFKRMRPANE